MQRWDYHVWYLDTSAEAESIRNDLDRWGREGWELVSVVPHTSSVSGPVLVAIFKRPLREEVSSEPMVAVGP
jgi:hypothetical protein